MSEIKKLPKGHYLLSSESISRNHPDKLADVISDSLIDNFIAYDNKSHCAIEVMCTTGQVIVAGEVKSKAYIPIEEVVRSTVNRLGYTRAEYQFTGDSCGVLNAIHEQSPDIDMGVTKENLEDMGAGDNGIYFGYACEGISNYMPPLIDIARKIMFTINKEREDYEDIKNGADPDAGRHYIPYLRPDGKCMVTGEFDENHHLIRITDIVICQQHDEFDKDDASMQKKIREDFIKYIMPQVIEQYDKTFQMKFGNYETDIKYYVNPTSRFILGGCAVDCGVTGRKLVCDLYGGALGSQIAGGSLSSKCFTKTDRSMNYFTRYVAKNLVAAGIAERCLVQSASAIGVAEPVSIMVNTYGTAKNGLTDTEISEKVAKLFDWRPYGVIKTLKLDNPIYTEAAEWGQVGHESRVVTKWFHNQYEGDKELEVELFTWEKLDAVDRIKEAFKL